MGLYNNQETVQMRTVVSTRTGVTGKCGRILMLFDVENIYSRLYIIILTQVINDVNDVLSSCLCQVLSLTEVTGGGVGCGCGQFTHGGESGHTALHERYFRHTPGYFTLNRWLALSFLLCLLESGFRVM